MSRRLARCGVLPQTFDLIVSFDLQRQFWGRLPSRITVKDVCPPIGSWVNRCEAEARLHWDGSAIRRYSSIRMILSEVVIHSPGKILLRLGGKPEQFILKPLGGCDLLGPFDQPVVQRKAFVNGVTGGEPHVEKGQKV